MKKSKEKFDNHILKRGTDATQSKMVRPLPARLRALTLSLSAPHAQLQLLRST